jgi:hypothetical protein
MAQAVYAKAPTGWSAYTKDQRIRVKEQLGYEGRLTNPLSWERTGRAAGPRTSVFRGNAAAVPAGSCGTQTRPVRS